MKIRLSNGVVFEVKPALTLAKNGKSGMEFDYLPGVWAIPGGGQANSARIELWAEKNCAEVIW